MSLKIKITLLSLIILLFIGWFKTSSYTKKNSSNDYLLVTRASSDNNGFLDTPIGGIYVSFFQDYRFKMNYIVTPRSVDYLNSSDIAEFTDNIIDISKSLDKDSTFMIYLNAHGNSDGTLIMNDKENLTANDILEALKEGRTKEGKVEPFKRFVILNYSYYSESFITDLYNLTKTEEYNSMFTEGIYIASSDAADESFSIYSSDLVSQMLFLYRAFQVEKCKNPTSTTIYKSAYDNIYSFFNIKGYQDHNLKIFEKCFSYDTTPEIFNRSSDLEVLVDGSNYIKECLKKLEYDPSISNSKKKGLDSSKFSVKVFLSDEKLRTESIFPPIVDCK